MVPPSMFGAAGEWLVFYVRVIFNSPHSGTYRERFVLCYERKINLAHSKNILRRLRYSKCAHIKSAKGKWRTVEPP